MGVNVKFTVAVIVVVVIGFTASSYFFSTQPISIDLFDKSAYIQEIDACLESQTLGEISLNSFAKNFLTNLRSQAEAAESEEEIKEIINRLYTITDCEP